MTTTALDDATRAALVAILRRAAARGRAIREAQQNAAVSDPGREHSDGDESNPAPQKGRATEELYHG